MAYCGPRGIALGTFLAWPQDDQDAALEWTAHEARRCSRCGTHPDEGSTHVHEQMCTGCAKRDAAEKASSDEPGVTVRLAHGTAAACTQCAAEHEANRRR